MLKSKHITEITITSLLLTGVLLNLPVYAAGNNQASQQVQQTVQQNNNQVTATKANPFPKSVELSPMEKPVQPAQSAISGATRVNPPALGAPKQ